MKRTTIINTNSNDVTDSKRILKGVTICNETEETISGDFVAEFDIVNKKNILRSLTISGKTISDLRILKYFKNYFNIDILEAIYKK